MPRRTVRKIKGGNPFKAAAELAAKTALAAAERTPAGNALTTAVSAAAKFAPDVAGMLKDPGAAVSALRQAANALTSSPSQGSRVAGPAAAASAA
jgi:hypothetical protein